MINVARRNFITRYFGYGTACSLGVVTGGLFFHDFGMKLVSEKFYLMGTHGKIQVFVSDVDYGTLIIRNAINKIKDLELLLTKFSPDSDVGIINNYPSHGTVVSDDTLFVLECGNKISVMTDGYFDMGLGNVLSSVGIDSSVPLVGKSTNLCNLNENLLNISGNKVKLTRQNAMIDLGGIGKGYALDKVIEIFLNAGIKHVAIEFGGDVRVHGGMPSGKPWNIMFDKSLFKAEDDILKMHTGSLAVSAGYLKRSSIPGIVEHHIINPKSLSSQNNYFLSVVRGKDSIICDALATASYSMNTKSLYKVRNSFTDYDIKVYV